LAIDSLINSKPSFKIIKEIYINVHHFLLSNSLNLQDIKSVISHPQALNQCMKYLETNLPNAKFIDSDSTASGAELASKIEGAAAVGSEILSSLYNLHILQSNIETLHNNRTRFMVLANCEHYDNDTIPTGNDLTIILFSLQHDKPKSLNNVLSIFIAHNVELVRIDSRPTMQHLWY
jgi:prephenate dehydratase